MRSNQTLLLFCLLMVSPLNHALQQPPATASTAPSVSTTQTEPASLVPVKPAPVPASADVENNNATGEGNGEIYNLQKDILKLKLQEKQVKLQESIAKSSGAVGAATAPVSLPAPTMQTTPATKAEPALVAAPETTFFLRNIYGVDNTLYAIIFLNGAKLTVKPGSDLDGTWRVASISDSTVRITDGKHFKTLSMSAPQISNTPSSTANNTTPSFNGGGTGMHIPFATPPLPTAPPAPSMPPMIGR